MRLKQELSLNPGERSALTASRVNVRNRKYKKELASKQKGIDDEMKFDNVLHSKENALMQNRLSRLTLVTGSTSRPGNRVAPFSSASPTNLSGEVRRLSSRDSSIPTLRLPSQEASVNYSPVSSIDVPCDGIIESERRPPTEDRLRRHVHFLSDRTMPSRPGSDYIKTRRRSEPVLFRNRDNNPFDTRNESPPSSSLPFLQYRGISNDTLRTDEDTARSHTDEREIRRGRSGSLFVGNMKGFSNLSSPAPSHTPRNSLKAQSGLEDELIRFRRLHHTRAVNARIKAVRSGGKRHSTCATLRERMDQEALIRKEQALYPQPFDATRAWSLLNCGYLRLTASNIATLEEICSKDGYDVSAHPHKHVRSDSAVNTDVVFKDLRENHLSKPDLRSQLQFRQNVLMRRFSEGFNTIH